MRLVLDTLEVPGDVARTPQGWEIRRSASVQEIGGTPATRLTRAAMAPGLPPLGSAHPGAPGARLDRIEVAGYDGDTDSARLSLVYRTLNAETTPDTRPGRGGVKVLAVEFWSQTQTERTTQDAAGREMITQYFGNWQDRDGETQPFLLAWETFEVDVYRPQFGVRIRHERASLPRELAPAYVGAVNSDWWSRFPPYTWLCTGFQSDNSTGVWVSVFEALYRPQGWRYTHTVTFDGRPIARAVRGNGIADYDVYPAKPFHVLGIKF
ncbi:MAG: hypothetical protein K2Y51_09290 [Gammaproteobacteria bacterium]|nr:hypothetical protein [Gammaproteobacteria bacterium]